MIAGVTGTRPLRSAALALIACASAGGCGTTSGLGGSDSDGIKGGTFTFVVTVSDDAFAPAILKAQNDATVHLTLSNTGTRPHDFVVPAVASARVPSVAPGASATVTFTTPDSEGIYVYASDLPGDAQTGQLIIQ